MLVRQVRFKDLDSEGNWIGGILIDDDYIICGCCGGVFEMEDIETYELLGDWIDISAEIIGN